MKYAIIAAGEGSRLVNEGYPAPKPMVKLGEKTLIERLLKIFENNNAEEIHVIINEQITEIEPYIHSLQLNVPVYIYIKTTESSLHSFYEIIRRNPGLNEVCLTTTDTIFDETDFKNYIHHFIHQPHLDGLMAVTDFVDDESPLYVSFDNQKNINGFLDASNAAHPFVSGGIYCLRQKAFEIATSAVENGVNRMRNYQRELLSHGLHIEAFQFKEIIDIDHISDIQKAQAFINA